MGRSSPKSIAWIALLARIALVALTACGRAPHAWEQVDGGDARPPLPPLTAAPAGGASATLAPSYLTPDGGTADPDAPAVAVPVGGAWVRCYGHFKPSGEPLKDVTRLGLMCGPSNGMRRAGDGLSGEVGEGGAPLSQAFGVQRGACYRVFAVAEASVADLDVTLRSSRGSAIAADHGEDAWPIVQPDRPICALEDDHWTVEVRAKRGKGRFAAEVWVLPPPVPSGGAH